MPQLRERVAAVTDTPGRSRRATLRLVADLYYTRELGLKDIAAITSLSTATISRLLKQARESGVVQITVEPSDTDTRDLGARLSDSFGLEVAVFPSHTSDAIRASHHLGAEAADLVLQRLPRSGVLGLAAGHSMHALVQSLPAMRLPELTIVPAIGGYHPAYPHLDTNALARDTAERVGGTAKSLLLPAAVDSIQARKALLDDPMIQEVTSLWDKVDTTVASTSAPASATAPGFSIMESVRGRTRQELLDAGMVGDAFGHLFTIDGDFTQDRWADRLNAISLDQLRRTRQRIFLVGGPQKVPSALGLARSGIPTLLVIDETIARALAETNDAAGPK